MTPIYNAINHLKVLHPEYFQTRRGRTPVIRYRMKRPNMLSETVFEGFALRDLSTPAGMREIPVSVWKDWFDEIVAENLGDSAEQLTYLAYDLTMRCRLNSRQKTRFFPRQSLTTKQRINTILAFCLQGAVSGGAEIKELSPETFTLAADNGEWGIRKNRICHTDFKLTYPLNYNAVVTGTAWRGSNCRNSHLVLAHYEADKVHDAVARELLVTLFWQIPEANRIDRLCTH